MKRYRPLSSLLIILTVSTTVTWSESFRDSPVSTTALTHHPLNLTCYAPDPSPPPSVAWIVNSVIVQSNDSRRNIVYDSTTGRSTYQLFEVVYSDAGQYQCRAQSETGSNLYESDVGTLTVQGQPAFTRPLLPVITPLSSQAVFQCRVISNPPANVSWTFGNPPQNLSNGGRVFLNSSALIISNVQSSDEGYYHCLAENPFGVNSSSALLTIGDPPPPTELTILPSGSPLRFLEGTDVTLRCLVGEGAAVDTLQWVHGGEQYTDQVTRESSELALSLDRISVEEGGEYVCVASTSDSSVNATVQLEILVAPTVVLVPNTSDILVINYTLGSIPQCVATGVPEPTLTWLGPGGEPLVVEAGVPVLGRLTRSISGVYVCVATNTVGQARVELMLTVEDAPLISVPPSDTLAAYGSDVTLTCVAEGVPAPSVVWSRGDAGSIGNSSVEVTGTLHLFSVTVEDGGEYVCKASNGYEPADIESASLTVLGPPRVTSLTVLPSPSLLSGTDFSIQCSVSAPSPDLAPPSISWYQNGTLLVPARDPRIQINEGSGVLTVYSADETYTGVYTCNASTSFAFDTAQVTVTVGNIPVIITAPSDVDLEPGQDTFIDCVVSGSPNPQIEWFMTNETGSRNQLITTVGEHYIIHTTGLVLHNATRELSGVYECQVDNGLGSDVKSAQVRVKGLPLPLLFHPTVLIADDNYTLTCDIIYNFPMATVTWRRTDGTPLSSDRFHTTPSGGLEISPVVPGDAGMYECAATNEYGETVVAQEVTVHVRPTVTTPSSPLTAILLTDVTLPCSVEGSPAPSQQWTLNDGTTLTTSTPLSGSHLEFVVATGDLVISAVQGSDTGNYTCMASNEVGVARAVVEVIVRGAPITNLRAQTLNSSAISLSWSHPPPTLTPSLSTYHIHYGASGSPQRDALEVGRTVSSALFAGLEEATQYQFSVYGDYGEGVRGVEVTVTATTDEDTPTGPPQNVSLDGAVEALVISWLPPLEAEQNGLIVRYNIYYRQTDPLEAEQNGLIVRYNIYYRQTDPVEGEEFNNSDPCPFTSAIHTPFDPLAARHSTRLGGLEGGRRYEVMISAATSVGAGPNSTLVSEETLEPFPLLLVLAISLPAATLLLLFSLLVAVCVCYRCSYRRSHAGKHSPLVEEVPHSRQQRRQHKRGRRDQRVISGPVPGIAPNINTTSGKFTMQTRQGELLSTDPKVIMPEDVAPPPEEGGVVQQVPHDEVLTSLKGKMDYNPYEEVTQFSPVAHHPTPDDLPPHVRSNPLYKPDAQDGAEVWGNPQYNRLTQSEEHVVPNGYQADPSAHGPQPNVSILLQGGSLPHVAHTDPITETPAGLGDKSQSLDMSANVWTGLPLIHEAEREYSEGSEDGREADERQRDGEGEREGEERQEGWGEGAWVQVQGDGWEERLIKKEAHDGGGEAEEEEEEEEEDGEGGRWERRQRVVVRRRVTKDGWQERYVGEEGEDPEIGPAPLGQTEDNLGASNNSLDLTSEGVEPVALETEDDTQNLYATIPESHKAKKRVKMLKDAQKRERKARKDKRKMEEKAERERRKTRERERKVREIERKKAAKEIKLRDDMGLGNVMRLHDVDTSTSEGRAQAQFIDAATAAIF